MQAAVWGPVGWTFVHSVAHGYPDDPAGFDRKNGLPIGTTESRYKMFFVLLGSILPCKYCRESYIQYVTESPPKTCSRSSLTKWLWEIHNKVNAKLGAQYKGTDFPAVCAKYESFRARCSDPTALGCTIPEGGKRKKRARVVIEDTERMVTTRTMVLITIVFGLLALLTLKTYSR